MNWIAYIKVFATLFAVTYVLHKIPFTQPYLNSLGEYINDNKTVMYPLIVGSIYALFLKKESKDSEED